MTNPNNLLHRKRAPLALYLFLMVSGLAFGQAATDVFGNGLPGCAFPEVRVGHHPLGRHILVAGHCWICSFLVVGIMGS